MNTCFKPLILTAFLASLGISPLVLAAKTHQPQENLHRKVAHLEQELISLKQEMHGQSHHFTNIHNRQYSLTSNELIAAIEADQSVLPFDFDVPGQAFVSTGPYVGVPFQFAGSNLIVNSPSVYTDVQLLNIRKNMLTKFAYLNAKPFINPNHEHLLLSGLVEGQAGYFNPGVGHSVTSIELSGATINATFFGPSDWTLGFAEFSYDNSPPVGSPYTATSNFRVSNSRMYLNRAFITIGDLLQSPIYGTFGQFYVPFGNYASSMISDPLTRDLARTKARAINIGIDPTCDNTLFGSAYIFQGDSFTGSSSRINNGGVDIAYRFKQPSFSGTFGAGVIANLSDSVGMQIGNNFQNFEHIARRVPAYNLRGHLSFGEHIDLIGEYVGAAKRYAVSDMTYNGLGARPWAFNSELDYSFSMFSGKPTSVGVGYGHSSQALALGLPVNRYTIVLNTSLFRNTLQSLEFRHDREYSATAVATKANAAIATPQTGRCDNAVTAQFDYYF